MNSRLDYIDFVRAYAIFLVTGFHLWRFFGKPSEEIIYYDFFSIFEKGLGGVELFFLISGYSMALVTYQNFINNSLDWKNYLIKRLFRIIPAYYVAIFIWTILIYNGIAPKPIGLIDQLSHILFIHTFNINTYYSISGVFWSLGIEMQFYFLLPLLLYYIIRFPIIMILIFLIPLLTNTFFIKAFIFEKTVIAFFVYFILGYITFIYKERFYDIIYNNKNKKIILFTFFLLFINVSFYKDFIVSDRFHMLIWIILFIPILIYLSKSNLINNSKNKTIRLFIFTGTTSYSIYLYNYIFYIHKKPFSFSFEAVVFYFLLVYLTGIAMYFMVEKPFQKFRKRIMR